jgi:hypothetical protein
MKSEVFIHIAQISMTGPAWLKTDDYDDDAQQQ